jgi:hypothetical protein
MLTLKTEEKLINRLKSLSEIELESVLDELYEHLVKNKMLHVANSAFGQDEIDELSHKLDEKTDEFDLVESELDDLKSYTQRAVVILEGIDEDGEPEEIRSKNIKKQSIYSHEKDFFSTKYSTRQIVAGIGRAMLTMVVTAGFFVDGKSKLAHRVSFEINVGAIADGLKSLSLL